MHAEPDQVRRAEHVRQLLQVTARLSSAVTEAEVVDIVLGEGSAALGADTGGFWRIDGDALVLAGTFEYPAAPRTLVARLPLEPWIPIADAALRRTSVWLESLQDYRAHYPRSVARVVDHLKATGMAVACIPLGRDGDIRGVLAFAFSRSRRFDDDERAFIELLAQHCMQGIERARLYDAERGARRRAEEGRERAAFLAKASSLLAGSLDYETTLRNVAMLAVPRMADWCAIEMVTGPGQSEQVAVAHVDPAKVELAKELRRKYPPDRTQGVYEVIRTGVAQLVPTFTDEMLVAAAKGDPDRLRLGRELSLHSWMVVPIRERERILGAISFVGAESGHAYGPEDVEMAEQLGERAGLAIASAQLYQAERRARAQLARLQEATAAFASARTLEDVGQVAVGLAMMGVLADRVMVWRCRDGDDALELIAHGGVPPEHVDAIRRIPTDADVPVAQVTRTREAFFTDAGFVPQVEGVVAGSAIPLTVQGELIGVLGLAFYQPRTFANDERAFLRSVADQCAQAVDRVRSYDEALKAVRVRDDFLSIAGHELRTPLTALHLQLGSLATLARQDGTPAKLGDRAGKALSHAERLARLVDELLDVSRVAQGRLTLDLDDVDLGELATQIVTRLDDELRRAGSTPQIQVVAVRGRWDRARLDQVLTNLLANAIKYGAGFPIEITVEDRGADAIVSVRDHGIGIDPEAQARIFDRFERAVSSRHYGGLGLGLWISRQIVLSHGGSIAVSSEAGAGARFDVILPKAGPT